MTLVGGRDFGKKRDIEFTPCLSRYNLIFLFDKEEVHTPPELIETRTYLLKESRLIGAIGNSASATTKRPESRGFQMSNMVGRTEEVFGKSYDMGHYVCHGA